MNSTHETIGVVVRGSIKLPPDVELPEGTRVRIAWEEVGPSPDQPSPAGPYDRQPLTEDDVRADLAWATAESRAK